ncbi:MAG: sugar phosphate isomerase/epimerase [Candidatus Latescibacteria bacterium]|nr:sugar phosphate isomerase/epimerase [Candidatus Latescibacterota bacterium]
MKIGIMDGALRQTWNRLFREAARLGYEGVELGIGSDYKASKLWHAEGRNDLAARALKFRIPVTSICLHSFWQYSFADPDEKIRVIARAITKETIGFCAELGVSIILVPVTNPCGAEMRDVNRRWMESIRVCAETAAQHHVTIGLENVGRSHIRSGEDMAAFLDAVGSPFVKAYYDVGNGKALGGDPVEEIRLLGTRILQVHIKNPGSEVLEGGPVDIPACIDALKEIGYDGYLVLETPPTDNPYEVAKRHLRYLRAILLGQERRAESTEEAEEPEDET